MKLRIRSKANLYFLHVILLPTLFFTTYTFRNWDNFQKPCIENRDDAIIGLQILRAKACQQYVGPYSRCRFNHPGPISFYYFALSEKLMPFMASDFGKHMFAQLLLNYSFLIFSLHVLYKSLKDTPYDCFLLFMSFLISLGALQPIIYASVWGPAIIILPMLLFILSSSRCASGDAKAFLPSMIAAVFVTQNHVGTLVVVVPLLIISLLLFFYAKIRHAIPICGKDVAYLLGALAILLIAYSLPLYEQLHSEHGNMSKIYSYFSHAQRYQHTFKESALFIASFYTQPLKKLHVGLSPAACLLIICPLALANIVRKSTFINHLLTFSFAGLILSVFGSMNVVGGLFEYLFSYEFVFVAIFYYLAISTIVRLIACPGISTGTPYFALPLAITIFITYAWTSFELKCDDTVLKLIEAIKPDKNHTYAISVRNEKKHHIQWGTAAGLVLQLVKGGYPVCISPRIRFMFGDEFTCAGKHNIVLVTLYSSDAYRKAADKKTFTYGKTTIEYGMTGDCGLKRRW